MTDEFNPDPDARSVLEMKRHINTIFEALLALCPSRNYLSQFLSFLPDDYASMHDSFPEFLGDRALREKLRSLLGFTYSTTIAVQVHSVGEKLSRVVALALEILSDTTLLGEGSELLRDARNGAPLPNPSKEWAIMRLQAAIEDPAWGKTARGVLDALAGHSQTPQVLALEGSGEVHPLGNNPCCCLTQTEIASRVSAPVEELSSVLDWLTDHLRVLQRVAVNVPAGTPAGVSERFSLSGTIKPEWLDEL